MRSYTTRLLLLFALVAGMTPLASGQAPGTCDSGSAEKDLDVNNVLARMFNTGSLFFGNTTTAGNGYIVPKATASNATPLSPIFASGIWVGGLANGDLRVAGSTYDRFEFWPGPLNDDGSLPNPSDCAAYDRIWKVSQLDIQGFEGTGTATADLASWPVELGAPVIAAPDNAFDDDGDGLIDEGTDGISNDDDNGDGIICSGTPEDPCPEGVTPDFVDERDEQERVVPSVRQAAGLPVYNLAGGDRPEIVGNQALWWVMNDVGNTHQKTLTPPIGIEVQVLAFSFARADALNDVTFYRYRVEKKSPGTLNQTFFSIFSDVDLGDAGDDFVGVDTTLSLGYVYNRGEEDANYGIPPATGYDFFQGPIVDDDGDGEVDDTLGITRFSYFLNEDTPAGDPDDGIGMYNFMQGLWGDATAMRAFGDGYQQAQGEITLFAMPGDPVTQQYWSEENVDDNGTQAGLGDRRFLVTTGPFDLSQGDVQEIVFGIVFGQGGDRLSSIDVMRAADALAQAAYDADFELAGAPPPPPRCDPNSSNPQLLPGSGHCLEAVELNGEAQLVWGYPTTNPNYLGSYEVFDQLLAQQDVPDKTYNFEGFHIYRYPTAAFDQGQRQLLATYDVINGVTTVIDTAFSAAIGDLVPFVALEADDTGIQYSLNLNNLGLVNYQDYYFGVTAFAYNFWSVPKVIESSASLITVRPSNLAAGAGGSVAPAELGRRLAGERIGGVGAGTFIARVVDPTAITGAMYSVEIVSVEGPDGEAPTFRILRDGEPVFSGVEAYSSTGVLIGPNDQRIVIDGLEFFQVDPLAIPTVFASDATSTGGVAGDGAGLVEVSYPGTEVCGGGGTDTGCQYPTYLGGNTVWQSPNSTGSYVITNPDNDLGDLSRDLPTASPEDYEIRFTEECATAGTCFGVYASALPQGSNLIVSVPFELWNVGNGRAGFAEDDIRMIPLFRALSGTEPVANWANSFPAMQEVIAGSDTLELSVTQRVIGVMPDRPNGYDLFAEAASRFGGAGGTYDPDNDGDAQVDSLPDGSDCRTQNFYADFCYRGGNTRIVAPIGGLEGIVFADLDMDGNTPPAGTTIRMLTTPKDDLVIGDRVAFDTAGLEFQTEQAEVAQDALDLIGVVPNPYMGRSAYESGNLDRVVRFINMPDQATIRIYTVAGTLIRTLQKEGPSRSLDWDLNTHNQLPVASGMYLIHVDVPGVGEKVLKFGVVNRRNRITVF